ncbi:hypothetical protein [Devosia aquimaris]|uniref:hypothetical protein n=1 Tax=Devosia aquimaris TaxID=2866214 RepID=UPI001CD0F0FE|nr:hypothetical protein [Devosia sp. CJK-A8-3]
MSTGSGRNIVLGKNSTVWQALCTDSRLASGFKAIGHSELDSFAFAPGDRVWVLSYARDLDANRAMFARLATETDIHVFYISTATANVDAVTDCYQYPRVKRACEQLSQSLLNAHIVTIGVVYRDPSELPGGTTMATSLDEIAAFMAAAVIAEESGGITLLFSAITRPFANALERSVHAGYGWLQARIGWPCLLRPVDIVLRALGWRWYGYLYLSNRLWLTTTS